MEFLQVVNIHSESSGSDDNTARKPANGFRAVCEATLSVAEGGKRLRSASQRLLRRTVSAHCMTPTYVRFYHFQAILYQYVHKSQT